jgi:uncharacterized protein YkwD
MFRGIGKAAVAGIASCAAVLALAPSASADPDTACTGDGVVASDGTRAQVELALLCLVNRYRQDNALPPLHDDTRLSAASLAHSDTMNLSGFFDHTNPSNPLDTPGARAALSGYPGGVGENLAGNGGSGGVSGIGTAFSLFDQWRGSSFHNQNMLTRTYLASGLGVDPGCWCGGENYGLLGNPGIGAIATQMFGLVAPNTGTTAMNLNFGAIPGSVPTGGGEPKKKKKCKPKKKKKGKKKKKCKKKRKSRSAGFA